MGGGGAPSVLATYFTNPEAAFVLGMDLLINPLLIVNTGYLAGVEARAVAGPVICSWLNTGSTLAAVSLLPVVAPLKPAMFCFALSGACILLSSYGLEHLHNIAQ